jgi:exopolysaccharide biosynthesis protein
MNMYKGEWTVRKRTGPFLFLWVAILSACSTLSPAGGTGSATELPLAQFADISSIQPDWQPVAGAGEAAGETGISSYTGRIASPRLQFHVLKINMDSPGLRIVIGPEATGPGIVPSTYVSSFVEANNLVAGINTVPFEPSSAREGEERRVVGVGINRGRLIAPPVPLYDALVFYRDGGVAIVSQGELANAHGNIAQNIIAQNIIAQNIIHASGGFHCILRNGELTERAIEKQDTPRHARSAAGLSADSRSLYLIAIDGSRLGNPGATEAEIALILKQLGAQDALNLDGGGSSALALRFPDGKVRILNTPAHGGVPGRERAVALCLGFGVE